MNKNLGMFLRYLIALLIALPNLFIFYLIFTPLTLTFVSLILGFFYPITLIKGALVVNKVIIELVPACIAGSAYYLLVALNLATPMKAKTRIKSLSFLILTFFIVNVLRIALFSILAVRDNPYFAIAHELTWYFGSTIFVVILWFTSIAIFKIDKIPIYSDLRRIINDIAH